MPPIHSAPGSLSTSPKVPPLAQVHALPPPPPNEGIHLEFFYYLLVTGVSSALLILQYILQTKV